MGSIRAGQISWAIPRGWSVSRCPWRRWVGPWWTCPPACCPRGRGPRPVVGRARDLRARRRPRVRTGAGSRDPLVLDADGPLPVNRATPGGAALTLCQGRPTPRVAILPMGTARQALTGHTVPALPSPSPWRAATASLRPLRLLVPLLHLPCLLIRGSQRRILLLSAWRTRGGSLCACPPCSRSSVTFSGSKKGRPQRRLPRIGGVSGISRRLS